jgi:predicted branched-subunit amino acid permease
MTRVSADLDVRRATTRALSVAIPTATYGISVGALGVAAGLSTLQVMAMSVLLFSGASQFAFIGLIGTGAPAAAVTSSALLGLRNGFYSITVRRLVPIRGLLLRVLGAQLTIDESTAVALAAQRPAGRARGFWLTGGVIYVGWNLFTLIGAVLGNRMGDPARFGLDAVSPAAFLALLWPRLHDRTSQVVAALAVALALLLSPVLPAGLPVLAAALVAIVAGVRTAGQEPA